MLNFRNTNIFFLVLLAVSIGVQAKYGLPVYVYVLLFIAWSLIVFWGCINVSSNFFLPIICKADTMQKEIAISFDDGPAANYTPAILSILKHENVKATFFCIGNRVAGNEAILKQVYEEGHIIGNHSYSHHFWFDMYPVKKMKADLQQMDDAVQRTIGVKPALFRPPYGVTNPNLAKAVRSGGYTPVGWSVRSLDTVAKDEQQLLNKVTAGIKPGVVFLFHDTCKITLDILPEFLKEVKKRGYNIVPLDKLLALQPYA